MPRAISPASPGRIPEAPLQLSELLLGRTRDEPDESSELRPLLGWRHLHFMTSAAYTGLSF